jgi:hypothetical protein
MSFVFRPAIISLLLLLSCCFGAQVPSCDAQKNPDLIDDGLKQECDWAFFLDVQDVNHFLNYSGSQLHPLSRVRVSVRKFSRSGQDESESSATQTYEELWYRDGMPIGLRRRSKLTIKPHSLGMVTLGATDFKEEHSRALANALIRLLIDLQFRQAVTSVVVVPADDYDRISAGLNRYHFFADINPSEGKQMSIHLSSTPAGKDGYFFLLRK